MNTRLIKNDFKRFLLDEGITKKSINETDVAHIFNKTRFNSVIDNIINIWQTDDIFTFKLDIINKMKLTFDYLNNQEYQLERSLLVGSLKVCFSSIIRVLYTFKNQSLTFQLTGICTSHLINFLQLCKELYKNADKLTQGEHFNYEPKVVYDFWINKK